MALFSKGITLTQYKEPALSRDLAVYTNPQPVFFTTPKEISTDPEELTAKEIISIAKAAQIYDDTDGRLLVSKLRRMEGKASTVLIDAVDDEPYVSSKLKPMMTFSEELIIGMKLCAKVAGADDMRILVYKSLTDLQTSIPSKIGGYKVERLRGGYPALPSTSQLSNIQKGKQMLVGAAAAIHLARAVLHKKMQTTTFITVHGNCVANPLNLEVSLGMNLTEIIERCGLIAEPTKIVAGGPMRGIAVIDTDTTLVTPTTRAVLAFRSQSHEQAYACIGCGRCEKYCPVGLNPMYLHRFVKSGNYNQMPLYDAHYCIGCGTCSYICPSRLNLVGAALQAKKYAIENFDLDIKFDEEDDLEV